MKNNIVNLSVRFLELDQNYYSPRKGFFSNKNYIICGSLTASPSKSDPVIIQNLIWNFLKVTYSQKTCKPMETIEIGFWWVKLSAMKWGSTDLFLEKNVAASSLFSAFLFASKKAKFCIQLHSPKKMEINIVIFIFFYSLPSIQWKRVFCQTTNVVLVHNT